MKHATTRILFSYWDALRGERAAPERGDVQPGGMRHILSDAFVLAAEAAPAFRLAGSRICTMYGRDLAGFAFRRLWREDEAEEATALLSLVTHRTAGVVLGLLGTNLNGSEIAMEMLLLPLRHNGRTDSRVLGALSPATTPSWAGLVPLAHLQLRSQRIIDGVARSDLGLAAANWRRSPLVLHEGGAV